MRPYVVTLVYSVLKPPPGDLVAQLKHQLGASLLGGSRSDDLVEVTVESRGASPSDAASLASERLLTAGSLVWPGWRPATALTSVSWREVGPDDGRDREPRVPSPPLAAQPQALEVPGRAQGATVRVDVSDAVPARG